MESSALVDPELLPLLEFLPAFSWSAETLDNARSILERMSEAVPLPDLPVEVSTRSVPRNGEEGEVTVFIFRPRGVRGLLPAMLDIHGGGYIAGSAKMNSVRNITLAHDLGCVVVSVDYRLAPEAPYPAALNDCYTALRWLNDNAASLCVDTARIAISGESAGGGLTAALGLLARDRGEIPLAAQILTYPMLDDRTASTVTHNIYTGEFVWDAASNRFGWECYLGSAPGGAVEGYSVPGRFEDLAGLPPTFIAIGQLDLFVGENIDYARRLIEVGVPTELHIYAGAFHGFDFAPNSSSAASYAAAVRAALTRAFKTA